MARRLNISPLRHPLFLAAAALYLLYRLALPFGLVPPLLRFYLSDLLCMPLVLSVALFLQRNFPAPKAAFVYTPHQVGLAVVYYSIAFELVLPHYLSRYTADWWDVAAYAAGGLLFYLFLNKPASASAA